MTTPARIPDQKELEASLASGRFLLFKHSLACPVSARAFHEYERFASDHPDVATAWLEVREQRPLSRLVEERSGVRHESPQAILFDDGQASWHASHGAITAASLAEALA